MSIGCFTVPGGHPPGKVCPEPGRRRFVAAAYSITAQASRSPAPPVGWLW
ncbi:hypothetical protein XINFAN_01400 [Pseudogemmobacter humi]|uniref:Uncharacterized protein n=1 Tax=Pseudogemmobacter humi TaxID=2483812 RepID=A0A3P5X9U6_9RHOB|nr:hypothetical protein XINFAN_01400 [Pseudogemmobacter humi]